MIQFKSDKYNYINFKTIVYVNFGLERETN